MAQGKGKWHAGADNKENDLIVARRSEGKMGKWGYTILGSIGIGILCLSIGLCYADSGKLSQQATFVKYLAIGPAAMLNLTAHGAGAEVIDERLSTLYSDNELQPFWLKDGKVSQRGADIFETLAAAGNHGLDPEDYFVSHIQRLGGSSVVEDQVKLDILLSLGMMRYVADQREGRLEPRALDPELFATARDVEVDWPGLKKAAFTASDMKSFLAAQVPPFIQYRQLQRALQGYRELAAQGGWPLVAAGVSLKPGMTDPRIQQIRKRLMVSGELSTDDTESALYDPSVEHGVRLFQKRHNLEVDGIVGRGTIEAMNMPVEARIEQIIVNMERYRWLKRHQEKRFLVVNIAAYELFAVNGGEFEIKMPVIVGKKYHETPVFSDMIEYVVFNPYWTLTPSIASKETLPKLRKDSSYLLKNKMRIFQGWGENGVELDATTIDWNKVTAREMHNYRIRQEPGPDNALGTLKLIFPNDYNVYLHDTPAHVLFKRNKRSFSHGCIRMSQPAEAAAWVLGGKTKNWDVERVANIIESRQRQVVVLEKPMPIHLLYRTVYIDKESNGVYFYEDVYGRDAILAKALFGAGDLL